MARFPDITIFNKWLNQWFQWFKLCFNRWRLKQWQQRSETMPPLPQAIWQKPLYFAAFGLGSGAMPIAPGTFGTLLAMPFFWLLQSLPLIAYLIFVLFFTALSIWICDRVGLEIQVHDHPGMCIDEFAGYFVTMIHAPQGWRWMVIGFLLFRLFDIWKPGPIRFIDKTVPGGLGMVLDDVVAGLFAMVVLQLWYFAVSL